MADVPKELQTEIAHLKEIFTVEASTLKKITEHFISELTKGAYTMWDCEFKLSGYRFDHRRR